ncbi:MAG: hypothetical protein M3Q33_13390, partial [Acidobacteriota bacterium]|nr:hypothetical protein [Acidobacteriota bacterium]
MLEVTKARLIKRPNSFFNIKRGVLALIYIVAFIIFQRISENCFSRTIQSIGISEIKVICFWLKYEMFSRVK